MACNAWSKDEYKKLEKYMDSGLSPAEIARVLNRSYRTTHYRCTIYASKPKTQHQSRPCLCCSKPFLSSGFGNRLCGKCAKSTAGYQFEHKTPCL